MALLRFTAFAVLLGFCTGCQPRKHLANLKGATISLGTSIKVHEVIRDVLVFPEKVNWFKANLLCQQQNMEMLHIFSAEDDGRVSKLTKNGGLGEFWLGATKQLTQVDYTWAPSGRPLNYTNWATGEPKNPEKWCVLRSEKTASWRSEVCGNGGYSVICVATESQMKKLNNERLVKKLGKKVKGFEKQQEEFKKQGAEFVQKKEKEELLNEFKILQQNYKLLQLNLTEMNNKMEDQKKHHNKERFELEKTHFDDLELHNKEKENLTWQHKNLQQNFKLLQLNMTQMESELKDHKKQHQVDVEEKKELNILIEKKEAEYVKKEEEFLKEQEKLKQKEIDLIEYQAKLIKKEVELELQKKIKEDQVNQREILQQQVYLLQSNLTQMDNKLEDHKKQHQGCLKKIEELETGHADDQYEKERLENLFEKKVSELELLKEEIGNLTWEHTNLQQHFKLLQLNMTQIESELKDHKKQHRVDVEEKKELNILITKREAEYITKQEECLKKDEELKQKADNFIVKLAEKQVELDLEKKEKKELLNQREILQQHINLVLSNMTQIQIELDDHKKQHQECRKEIKELKTGLADDQNEKMRLEKLLEAKEAELMRKMVEFHKKVAEFEKAEVESFKKINSELSKWTAQ